jgi:hypothetical protein
LWSWCWGGDRESRPPRWERLGEGGVWVLSWGATSCSTCSLNRKAAHK